MFKIKFKSLIVFLAIFILSTQTATTASRDIALVLKIKGDAEIKSTAHDWLSLKRGRRLQSGDKIRTGQNSMVALVFNDDKSMMKIRSDSEVTIKGERKKRGIAKKLFMNLGGLWAKVTPKGAGFTLETPSGVAAVKGTEFYGLLDSDGVFTIIGITGIVELFNELGTILVEKGMTGTSPKGQEPSLSGTDSFDDWANQNLDENELNIEFENADGSKKQLYIKYRKEE